MEIPKAEDLGASHIAFYTDDIASAVARLRSQGILVLGEPITMASGLLHRLAVDIPRDTIPPWVQRPFVLPVFSLE
jgi:hypothetical protein